MCVTLMGSAQNLSDVGTVNGDGVNRDSETAAFAVQSFLSPCTHEWAVQQPAKVLLTGRTVGQNPGQLGWVSPHHLPVCLGGATFSPVSCWLSLHDVPQNAPKYVVN